MTPVILRQNLSLIQHAAKRKDHNQLLIFKQIQMINGLKNSTTSSVFGYAAEKWNMPFLIHF